MPKPTGMQPRNCPRGARARSSRATRLARTSLSAGARSTPRGRRNLAARQCWNICAATKPTRITSPANSGRAIVTKLGDIVSSAPLFVGRPPFRYRDNLEGSGSVAYSTFVLANDTDAERTPMVYAGANDGMLHGFNANTGVEVFAFVPTPMFKTIGASPLGAHHQAGATELRARVLRRRFAEPGRCVLGRRLAYGRRRRPEQGRPGHLCARRHEHLAAGRRRDAGQRAGHDPVGVHRRQRCRPGIHLQSAVDREVARHDGRRHGSLGRRFRQRLQQHVRRWREQHDRQRRALHPRRRDRRTYRQARHRSRQRAAPRWC